MLDTGEPQEKSAENKDEQPLTETQLLQGPLQSVHVGSDAITNAAGIIEPAQLEGSSSKGTPRRYYTGACVSAAARLPTVSNNVCSLLPFTP